MSDLKETIDRLEHSKPLIRIAVVFVIIVVLAGLGIYFWSQEYTGRIAPNIWIGNIEVGGLDPEEAHSLVQQKVDEILAEGLMIEYQGDQRVLPLATLAGSDIVEDVEFDVDSVVDQVKNIHRDENPILDSLKLTYAGFAKKTYLKVPVGLNEEALQASVRNVFPDAEKAAEDAKFDFQKVSGDWQAKITETQTGIAFTFDSLFRVMGQDLQELKSPILQINATTSEPEMTEEEAEKLIDDALKLLEQTPIDLTYTDEYDRDYNWQLADSQLADLLSPTMEGISIDEEAFETYLEPIAESIEREAANAELEFEEGRVTEFVSGKDGVVIDREVTTASIMTALADEELTQAEITIEKTKPDVAISDLNDLGIKEVLGVGTSDYWGSPPNRIKNIRNGIRLLNGILIEPDETFSLIGALRPFNFDNGYLPELVIKGDKIEPEVGGGLCQIGTTTFRTTMNSGFPITERRNHSLVVSYYNDPSNGNPGTDATIYEPAPDFKFHNDTGHHVLFQAEMLEDISELRFTFWGTSDGRQGSYTAPVVYNWIGVGDPIEIETTDLETGEEKCQGAHVGANTSFTYTIVRPDGEAEEVVYDSHYRPLPKICLVGVEEISEEDDENTNETDDQENYPQTEPVQ